MMRREELLKATQGGFELFNGALDDIFRYLDAHPAEEELRVQTVQALSRYKHRFGQETSTLAERVLASMSARASGNVLRAMFQWGVREGHELGVGRDMPRLAVNYMRDHARESDWGQFVKDYLFNEYRLDGALLTHSPQPWNTVVVQAILDGLRQDPDAFASARGVEELYDYFRPSGTHPQSVPDAVALDAAAELARDYDSRTVFDFVYGVSRSLVGGADNELVPFVERLFGNGEDLMAKLLDYYSIYHPMLFGGLLQSVIRKYPAHAMAFAESFMDAIEREREKIGDAANLDNDIFALAPHQELIEWARHLLSYPETHELVARRLTNIVRQYPDTAGAVREMLYRASESEMGTELYPMVGIGYTLHQSGHPELGFVSDSVLETLYFDRKKPMVSLLYMPRAFMIGWGMLYDSLSEANLPSDVFDAETIRTAIEHAQSRPENIIKFLQASSQDGGNWIGYQRVGKLVAEYIDTHHPEWHDMVLGHFLRELKPHRVEDMNPLTLDAVCSAWFQFAGYITECKDRGWSLNPVVVGQVTPTVVALERAFQTYSYAERMGFLHENIGDIFGGALSALDTGDTLQRYFPLVAPREVLTGAIRIPYRYRAAWDEWMCEEFARRVDTGGA